MITVGIQGLGAIGLAIARGVARHPDLLLAAAIDLDPAKVGRPLRDLDPALPAEVAVFAGAEQVHRALDVVLMSTSSRAGPVTSDAADWVRRSSTVITTCEELAFPWGRDGAEALHRLALEKQRAVLATGVNPGFVMDFLPAALSIASLGVRGIEVERIVDLGRRRAALREKAGIGLSLAEFRHRAASNAIGHVGLDSSARLIARILGLDDAMPSVSIEPIPDAAGQQVVGFVQTTSWAMAERPRLTLRLEMALAPSRPEADRISISGRPSFEAVIDGGIFGDSATAALVINAIPQVIASPGGLLTVLDLPPARSWRAE